MQLTSDLHARLLPVFLLSVLLAAAPGVLLAQSDSAASTDGEATGSATEMTVEELEQFITQQELALEQVRIQREQHQEKQRQVQLALNAREADLQRIERELLELCNQRKEIDEQTECPAAE